MTLGIDRLGVARVRATYPHKNMAVLSHKMGASHYVIFFNNILGHDNYILSEGEFVVFNPKDVIELTGKLPRVKSAILLNDFVKNRAKKYTVKNQQGSIVYQGSTQGLRALADTRDIDDYIISKE